MIDMATDTLPENANLGEEQDTAEAEAGSKPPKPKRRGSLGRLWYNTIGRALTGAVDEASDTVVNLGADIHHSADKLVSKLSGGRIKPNQDFLNWYALAPEERNPFKFGAQRREAWFGQKDVDDIGWAEDILQFTAGMVASNAALKAGSVALKAGQVAERGSAMARILGRVGRLDKAGFLADFAFMDPDENNLMDLIIKKAPDEQATLMQKAFASDPDDAETWNRLKAGLNGFIIGKALDRTLSVFKYMALSRKAAQAATEVEAKALRLKAADALEEFDKIAHPKALPSGEKYAEGIKPVDVIPNPQGEGYVVVREAEDHMAEVGAKVDDVVDADWEIVTDADGKLWEVLTDPFEREGAAHSHAAAVNEALPRASDELLFSAKTIQENILRAAKDGGTLDAKALVDGVNFNFHYIGNTDAARAWQLAVEETLGKAMDSGVVKNDELIHLAEKAELGPPSLIRQAAEEDAAKLREITVRQLARRAYMAKTSQYVSNLARLVERENMTNGINLEKLRIALGTLHESLPGVKKVSSEFGRGLQSHQIAVPLTNVDGIAPAAEAAVAVAKGADEAAEQLAKAAGQPTAKATDKAGTALVAGRGKAPATAGAFAHMTDSEILRTAKGLALAEGDEEAVARLLSLEVAAKGVEKGSSKWEWFNRLRYNSLLSGPRTHSKNLWSNLVTALWAPVENAASAVYAGDIAGAQEAFDIMAGLWRHKWESFTMFGKAFRAGTPMLDHTAQQEAVKAMMENGATEGQTYRLFGMELTRQSDMWIKEVLDIPSRLMMASDEMFKNLNYRAAVHADAMKQARQTFPTEPKKWAEWADRYVASAFDPNGGAISRDALEYARENTFTRELADGGWGSQVAAVVNGTPLKIVMPFVKTPMNAFLAVSERTPGLWRVSQRMREDLAAGGLRATRAQAKIQMGQDLWTLAAGLALSGHLTGGGPKDPRLRAQMQTAGWTPYSVKIPGTNKWVSYRDTEPLGTLIGIAADILESQADLHRDEREQELLDVTAAFAVGVANNVSNKTFLRGLSDFSSLLSGNEGAGTRWVSGIGGQLIPFGGFINQTTTDDTIKEARTVADRIIARTPFGNSMLEPVRNVFGRELRKESWIERTFLPFVVSDAGDTKEKRVMAQLLRDTGGAEFLQAPQGRYKGLNLKDRETFGDRNGQSPYDRLMELLDTRDIRAEDAGVVNSSGKLPPLIEAMDAMVQGDEAKLREYFGPSWVTFAGWSQARASAPGELDDTDTRKAMADDLVRMYKGAAMTQVLREYPSIQRELARGRQAKAAGSLSRSERLMGFLDGTPAQK